MYSFSTTYKTCIATHNLLKKLAPGVQKLRHTWLATGTVYWLKNQDRWPDGFAR
ncbi:MAG: hypothetical protein NTV31_05210 [Bacteroidia bacterium]|nr:hypothetical protein [Bacteroidia bacterium]